MGSVYWLTAIAMVLCLWLQELAFLLFKVAGIAVALTVGLPSIVVVQPPLILCTNSSMAGTKATLQRPRTNASGAFGLLFVPAGGFEREGYLMGTCNRNYSVQCVQHTVYTSEIKTIVMHTRS